MIDVGELTITRVDRDVDYWDKKTQKRIKYKIPKLDKKVVFSGHTHNGIEDLCRLVIQQSDNILEDQLGCSDVYLEIKFECKRILY